MAPKFLFLHGFGESEMLAGNSTSTLLEVLKPEKITVDVMDGFEQLKDGADFDPIPDEEYKSLCKSGDIEAFCWYPIVTKEAKWNGTDGGHRAGGAADFAYQPASAAAVKKCVDALIAKIDKMGGVDALVGFSQGGELCYLMMESFARLSVASQNKLKFIATFGSEDTFLNMNKRIPKLPAKQSVHAFLCYGDQDADAVHDVPTTEKKLKDAGLTTSVKKIAGHGHNMPKDKAVYKEMLKQFHISEAGKEKAAEPEYPPEKPEMWCVMTDPEGRCSLGKSDLNAKPVKPGTKYNDQWTIVATDFNEEDAKLYVRMNWTDMTPKSVADGHRANDHPKYNAEKIPDAEYDALWYRMTKAEWVKAAPAARIREAEEAEEEKRKTEERAAEREAKEKAKAEAEQAAEE